MSRFYKIGGYIQKVWPNGRISCTCIHGSIKSKNWEKGEIDDDLAAIIWWCIFVEGAVANANYDFIYKTSPNHWRL